MTGRKNIRTRGKFSFSKYFQKFKEGDLVAVTREESLTVNFPTRLQGRTGEIEGKRGRAYIVRIKDQTKPKQFLIEPIHLKRIQRVEKKE